MFLPFPQIFDNFEENKDVLNFLTFDTHAFYNKVYFDYLKPLILKHWQSTPLLRQELKNYGLEVKDFNVITGEELQLNLEKLLNSFSSLRITKFITDVCFVIKYGDC